MILPVLSLVLNLILAGIAMKAGLEKMDIDRPWYYMMLICYVMQTIGNFFGAIK